MTDVRKHIAIFVPSMRGGGAERVMLTLANKFAERGHRVDLVLAKAEGPYLSDISEKVRLVDLNVPRVLRSFWPLMRYLRGERPDAMLSALNYANVIAILAWKLARVRTRLIVSERSSLSHVPVKWGGRLTRALMRWLYPKADKVVCVSKGIEQDVQRLLRVPEGKTETIYNPVDVDNIRRQMTEPVDHPWFKTRAAPVILAAGRLTEAKDYPTLLRAFAQLREVRQARLVILGQGEEEVRLKALAEELAIANDVDFVGFQDNPFAWMARCDIFVMSSTREGFPNVLVQAIACGARVVSTNCPTGPNEILENGRWGGLVPVGDANELGRKIVDYIRGSTSNPSEECLYRFNQEEIIQQYLTAVLQKP